MIFKKTSFYCLGIFFWSKPISSNIILQQIPYVTKFNLNISLYCSSSLVFFPPIIKGFETVLIHIYFLKNIQVTLYTVFFDPKNSIQDTTVYYSYLFIYLIDLQM